MGKRPGSDAAAQLLTSNKLEEWQRALDSYDQAVARLAQEKGRAGLVELDRWWREDLPSAIRSRGNDLYVTKEELVKVVQWKLWVGAVRPNLLRFAKETNASQVEAKSREAFKCLPVRKSGGKQRASERSMNEATVAQDALKAAVTALTSSLKGVGPATASAVLAAGCTACPFDADEAIDAVMKTGVRKYTLPEYLKVHQALASKASRLGGPWDPEQVRRALWSRAMCSRFNLSEGDSSHTTVEKACSNGGTSHDDGSDSAVADKWKGTTRSKSKGKRGQDTEGASTSKRRRSSRRGNG